MASEWRSRRRRHLRQYHPHWHLHCSGRCAISGNCYRHRRVRCGHDKIRLGNGSVTITGSSSGGTASVSISPVRAALTTGQSQAFTATVTGNSVTTVTWEVDSIPGGNSSVGTVSATGVYSPPAAAGEHTVAARSVADTTASAPANVFVTDLAGVFTYHNDLSRDGVNSQEYALNTSTVKGSTIGKRFCLRY
jgi:hypothetical protein